MESLEVIIDGFPVKVAPGTSILEVCAANGVTIPTLCYWPESSPSASCGVCVVEVQGAKSLLRSCVTSVAAGMQISTASPRVLKARRLTVELLLANHPKDCLTCLRSGSCELQALARQLGVESGRFPALRPSRPPDRTGAALVRDESKCLLCGRCVAVCRQTQTVSAIDFVGRGARTRVAPFFDRGLGPSVCTSCGQCSIICPVGAIVEHDDTDAVRNLLAHPQKTVLVQVAPAVRASLGEALGLAPSSLVTGKMVAALRRLGFDRVFDTQFATDLTILEEGNELIDRINTGGTLPMITSCSPSWINFIETFYPSLLAHLSTCKSPEQMFGAVAKTWYAQKAKLDPQDVAVVSITPCTAKKDEARRPQMTSAAQYWRRQGLLVGPDFPDVDFALTVREFARMIRQNGLELSLLPEEAFDDPLGESTGAAVFGTTGGVMEATLSTVYEVLNQRPLEKLELNALPEFDGIKTTSVDLAGQLFQVAVGHTLGNARVLLDQIAEGASPYGFIEVMTCPGGCIGGGGQPVLTHGAQKVERQQVLCRANLGMPVRKSHENPSVLRLYEDFLGSPLGERSHELLHTHYSSRSV